MGSAVLRLIVVSTWMCSAVALFGCGPKSHDTKSGFDRGDSKSSDSDSDSDEDEVADSGASHGGKLATGTAKVDDDGTVNFQFDVAVPAGQELFKCIYGQFPTDGVTAVASAESHYTPGSHHMLAYRSDLTAIPDDQTGVWDCADGSWFIHQRGSYYEAQQPDEQRTLPEGVAHKFQPGEVIIIQAHYINVTDSDIDAHVKFNLHTMNVDDVKEEAGTIYFNDTSISIPPHARAGVTMTCPIPQDINLAFLWSHMHKRGTHFVVTTDDPIAGARLGSTLYEESDWSEPKPREYPEGEENELHAGSHITFSCEYQNDSDNAFMFGNSAETNEMCILHGMYWPRMPSLSEQCILGRVATRQMF
jgi:Copper type II ascorbate-dependent monooxygenase, C-terminal domain